MNEEKEKVRQNEKQVEMMKDIIEEDYSIAMDDFTSLLIDRNKLKPSTDVIKAVPKYL